MNYDKIPAELKQLNQWLVWKYEDIEGSKPTKIPYNAKTGYPASVTNASSYSSFEQVISVVSNYSGIGFVFTEYDPYCGIDLDYLENDQEGTDRQQLIFTKMNSWSERSPSGKGLHIFVKAKIPHGRKRHGIEVYSSNRFFTMTGDIFHDVAIADQQEMVNLLWLEMGQAAQENFYAGDFTQKNTDDEIWQMASQARNGDLFTRLWNGDTSGYVGNSEADFALVDIIAFYTKQRIQIQRMFLASVLGKREKYTNAKPSRLSTLIGYMVNKSFDRMLPPIDLSGLIDQFNAATAALTTDRLASSKGADLLELQTPVQTATADPPSAPLYDSMNVSLWRDLAPPGIMGSIVAFVMAASPRPVYEISLSAAIGILAGITGRAYNVSGTGLNHYLICLAGTGTGKEAMSTAINRLMTEVAKDMPSALEFIGPADLASGQGLLKHLGERGTPCFVSLVGEVGLRLQQMTDRNASGSDIALRRVMLDLFNKSGAGNMVHPTVYSDKKNNTDVIHSPSFSLLGESTPETFYRSVDEDSISQGLLPRFTIIEYDGPRVALNTGHHEATPSMELVTTMTNLTKNCHENMATGKVVTIGATPEATQLINEADTYSMHKLNAANKEVVKQLWNRYQLKIMKLAGLLAISVNLYEPTIDVRMVEWARSLVLSDILHLLTKFEAGQIGQNNQQSEQDTVFISVVKGYLTSDIMSLSSYGATGIMHEAKIIPYNYLQRKLVSMACYRHDKRGATVAIKAAIQTAVDSGIISEVPAPQLRKEFNYNGKAYAPTSIDVMVKV
jgi:hypothetical protein